MKRLRFYMEPNIISFGVHWLIHLKILSVQFFVFGIEMDFSEDQH
jgi:hypothetical protein